MTSLGTTFLEPRDGIRITAQREAIYALMRDQQWRTLSEIEAYFDHQGLHISQPSISARLRDFRKRPFGSYRVEREYRGRGLFAYRVLPPVPATQAELF